MPLIIDGCYLRHDMLLPAYAATAAAHAIDAMPILLYSATRYLLLPLCR